jgi:beta-fructofuranosidase
MTRQRDTTSAWQPRYHVAAARNFLNDPVGLLQHNGIYHLFFQANPAAPVWGRPQWEHVTSPDLATWRREPTALTPEETGPDCDGCWSGCTRVVDGTPMIYYTGIVGEGDQRVESVCRAFGSKDLVTWTKDPANPLIPGPPDGLGTGYHRDPWLWQDEHGWHLLLGSGTLGDHPQGMVLIYDSADATTWTYGGLFFTAPQDRPDDLGDHWECPQLVRCGDQWVLIFSIQKPNAERPLSHVVYFIGNVTEGRFNGRYGGRVDYGNVMYAPAVMVDQQGRNLLWGWAQEWLPLARQQELAIVGAVTLPRELHLVEGALRSTPVPELQGLRREPPLTGWPTVGEAQELHLGADTGRVLVGTDAGAQWELEVIIGGASGRLRLGTALTEPADTALELVLDLDRRVLSATVGGMPAGWSGTVDLPDAATLPVIRIYRDGSLLEILCAGLTITTRWYAPTNAALLAETIDGDAEVADCRVWSMIDEAVTGPTEARNASTT